MLSRSSRVFLHVAGRKVRESIEIVIVIESNGSQPQCQYCRQEKCVFYRRSMPQPQVAAFAAWPLGRSDDLAAWLRWARFILLALVRSVEYVQAADLELGAKAQTATQFSRFSVAPSVRITLILCTY